MGKVTSYDKIDNFYYNDVMLVDGTSMGTRQIPAADVYGAITDTITSVPLKRSIWIGGYRGTSVTSDEYAQIKSGLFKGLYLGDYWEINGVNWRIVDFDYWYGCNGCTTHHLVIMPDSVLYNSTWNTSGSKTIAYNPSYIHNSGLSQARTTVNNAFGSSHILSKSESVTTAVNSNNDITGCGFTTTTVEIPEEMMIYGTISLGQAYTYDSHGTLYRMYESSTGQLAGMAIGGRKVIKATNNSVYWLRDGVAYTGVISCVTQNGGLSRATSDKSMGVRPVFGLCG